MDNKNRLIAFYIQNLNTFVIFEEKKYELINTMDIHVVQHHVGTEEKIIPS